MRSRPGAAGVILGGVRVARFTARLELRRYRKTTSLGSTGGAILLQYQLQRLRQSSSNWSDVAMFEGLIIPSVVFKRAIYHTWAGSCVSDVGLGGARRVKREGGFRNGVIVVTSNSISSVVNQLP